MNVSIKDIKYITTVVTGCFIIFNNSKILLKHQTHGEDIIALNVSVLLLHFSEYVWVVNMLGYKTVDFGKDCLTGISTGWYTVITGRGTRSGKLNNTYFLEKILV